jgi:hypothetical protein
MESACNHVVLCATAQPATRSLEIEEPIEAMIKEKEGDMP